MNDDDQEIKNTTKVILTIMGCIMLILLILQDYLEFPQ